MNNLIKALQIFLKYVEEGSYQEKYPTHCEHDILYINCTTGPEAMASGDPERLEELGFIWELEGYGGWASFHYGSC